MKQSLDHRLSLAAVDAASGVIAGVSVIAIGPALGHGMMIDMTTLQQVKAEADKFTNGVKVKIDHGTGFGSIVGTLKNFRIDGEKLLADLWLLKSHDRFAQILESAEKMPDNFGLSIVFTGVNEEVNGQQMARCTELYSVDLVDEPAANPTGLFHEAVDSKETIAMAKTKDASGKFTRDSLISEILGMLKSVIGMQPSNPDEETPDPDKPEVEDDLKCKDKEPMEATIQAEKITAAEAKMTELTAKLEQATATIADLTAKLAEKKKLEDAEVEKAANLKAAETVRNLGVPNPKIGDVPVEKASVLEQFKALSGLEKTMFYRKNRPAIISEMQK